MNCNAIELAIACVEKIVNPHIAIEFWALHGI